MAITSAICNSFKREIAVAQHNFTLTTGSVFKIALYSSTATLDGNTTAYTAANEVAGTGYTAGGNTLINVTPFLDGSSAIIDFEDTSWIGSSISARGCMIYNSSSANKSVLVQDFGNTYTTSNGTFVLVFPLPTAAAALIRLA